MSLRNQSISAFFWASGQQISTLVLNLSVSIFLARILNPVEFGLIGMITIIVSLGSSLMNGGLTSSLIRTKDASDIEYSTIFFTNVIFSLIIYGVIFLIAPLIALFYDRPMLLNIIRVYALSIVIFSFSTVQLAKLTKELQFKKTMIIQLPSIFIAGVVGILMAVNGYGVWSLVWMYLIQAFVNTLLLWFKSGWRPKLEYSYLEFKKHFSFGFSIAMSGSLHSVYSNIYNLVIGKYFSAIQLGYYTRSFTLAQLPIYNLQDVLDRVTYPVLSRLQDDNEKLRVAYKQIIQSVLLLILPILALGVILGTPLFSFFLTDKWLPAAPYFKLICIGGMFFPLSMNNLNILKIKGKSGLVLRLGIVEKIVITIGIFLTIPFGIMGLLYFQIASSMCAFLMNGYFSGGLIKYSLGEQILDILKVVMIIVIAGIPTYFIYSLFRYQISDIAIIFSCTLFFLIIYVLTIFIVDKNLLTNIKKIIFKK